MFHVFKNLSDWIYVWYDFYGAGTQLPDPHSIVPARILQRRHRYSRGPSLGGITTWRAEVISGLSQKMARRPLAMWVDMQS